MSLRCTLQHSSHLLLSLYSRQLTTPQTYDVLLQQQPLPASAATPRTHAPRLHPRAPQHPRLTPGLPTLHLHLLASTLELPSISGLQLAICPASTGVTPASHDVACAAGVWWWRRRRGVRTDRFAAASRWTAKRSGCSRTDGARSGRTGGFLVVGARQCDGAVWDAARSERGRRWPGLHAEKRMLLTHYLAQDNCSHASALPFFALLHRNTTTVRRHDSHNRRQAPLQRLKLVRDQEAASRTLSVATPTLVAARHTQ